MAFIKVYIAVYLTDFSASA